MSYFRLNGRINRILKRLPPDPLQFNRLSEAKQDLVSSAILLVSAEIEEYIENSVQNIISISYDCWRFDKRATISLLSCIHSAHPAKQKEKIDAVRHEFSKDINQIICLAHKCALQSIKDNHGVGEDNLTSLLRMVGVDINNLNSDILILDSFTKKRGSIAHSSSKNYDATIVISPSAVRGEITTVMQAVKAIDDELLRLKLLCATPKELKNIRRTLSG